MKIFTHSHSLSHLIFSRFYVVCLILLLSLLITACEPELAQYEESANKASQVELNITLIDINLKEIPKSNMLAPDSVIHYEVNGRSHFRIEPKICCLRNRPFKYHELIDAGFSIYWKADQNISVSQPKLPVFSDSITELKKFTVWISDTHNDSISREVWMHIDTSYQTPLKDSI